MPHIIPFRGTFYNQEKIKNLFSVLAPPYDVISPEEQDELYASHENNIIRIILGKHYPGDDEFENRYKRAGNFFKTWLMEGLLIRDAIPSIYVYEQEFSHKWGGKRVRRGFFSKTRLEHFGHGGIFPHENTFPKPIADRYFLLQACRGNFNPIFAIFPDEEKILDLHLEKALENLPIMDFWDGNGMRHRVWSLQDSGSIKKIGDAMRKKKVFIADGHHRYETALKFRDEIRKTEYGYNDSGPYNYTMFYYSNMFNHGLVILPVHRAIRKMENLSLRNLEEQLKNFFFMETLTFESENSGSLGVAIEQTLASRKGHSLHSFVMYTGNRRFSLLTLKSDSILNSEELSSLNHEFRKLDLIILHRLILEKLLLLPCLEDNNDWIIYSQDGDSIINKVDSGECQLAIFVNPIKVGELIAIAEAGLRLPHKSTFFYPKLFSGLIINQLDF